MSNPAIRIALSIEEMFKANAQERRLYDMREKAVFSEATNLAAAEAKGKSVGKAEGKILMAQDAISQYLEVRFAAKSQSLQETICTINDLETLTQIINRIFTVTDNLQSILILNIFRAL